MNTSCRSGWRSITPREHQVPERAVGPPRDLEQEHGAGRRVVAVVGGGAAAVVVDRQPDLLAHRPDRLVVGGVERRDARAGRCAGEQDAAGQPVLGGPADLGDRALDVVQHDLADAGPAPRRVGAEVGEPAVVGPQPGPAPLEVAGAGARRLVHERRPSGRRAAPCSGTAPRRRSRRPRARAAGGPSPSCGRRRRRRGRRTGSRRSASHASKSSW